MSERFAKKVLLIGWDAADWKVLRPLMAAGHMPTLSALVARGVSGNIATLDPPFSPMLWTSIATGHTADRHGVLNFVQPDPEGGGTRPVLGSTRKVKALWNILTQSGLRSNVVGWWPSHPAEPIDGRMVSDFFQRATNHDYDAWPMSRGAVHPVALRERVAGLRVHPSELTAAHLLPFIPHLAEIDQEADERPRILAKILADTASVHAAATFVMDQGEWDLTAVYYDAIDHVGHGFMKYHPPQQAHIADADFRLYGDVVAGMYRFHDMMLEQLLEQAGEDTTVVLLSDHGFHSDHLRVRAIPKMPAGPALEHRTFGALVMAGPGLQRGEPLFGASLLDVTPTVLTLFGLPVGRDMRGHPLVQAFEAPPAVAFVDSWEDVPGEDGRLTEEDRSDPWAEHEAMRQLIELGYVEDGGDPDERAAAATREAAFNLARVYRSTGRAEEALPHFEAAHTADPEDPRLAMWLAQAYLDVGRLPETRELLERLLVGAPPGRSILRLLEARLLMAEGRNDDALDVLDASATDDAPSAEYDLLLGLLYLARQCWDDAAGAFGRARAFDPDNARAYLGLAQAAIGRKAYMEAAEAAMGAIERLYHFPSAHFHLGIALLRLGWIDRAEQAFLVAVAQQPGFHLAHRWLARLYNDYLRDRPRAAHHLALSREAPPA